eukprot:scaffold13500_cov46-Phaeocystis_antarctica.AAC.1
MWHSRIERARRKPTPKIASDCTEVQPCNARRCWRQHRSMWHTVASSGLDEKPTPKIGRGRTEVQPCNARRG